MSEHAVEIRESIAEDIPGIFEVRTSVRDNHLDREQLAKLGITPESLASRMGATHGSWSALVNDRLVGFSMSDRESGLVEALFVRPDQEGKGIGQALLQCAVEDLRQQGWERIRLFTGADTGAYAFYTRRGWRATGKTKGGDVELELAPGT